MAKGKATDPAYDMNPFSGCANTGCFGMLLVAAGILAVVVIVTRLV